MKDWEKVKDDRIGDIDHCHKNNVANIYMQYTGLKDCRGVEIYEGDILGNGKNNKNIYEVTFEDGCFDNTLIFEDESYEYFHNSYQLEVIGNIYENPELIQTKGDNNGT